jgi:hypothetical protein
MLYTVMSLFAIIIPLAPLIIVITSTISINLKIWADLNCFKRSPPKKASQIGLWLQIFDIVSTASIMFNCFLYYFINLNQFNQYTKILNEEEIFSKTSEFSTGSGEQALFWIVIFEHVFISLKYLYKYLSQDSPNWVVKERELLFALLEESNKAKEEAQNQAMENLISSYLNKFNSKMEEKDKKLEKKEEHIRSCEKLVEIYKSELISKGTKLEEMERIQKTLAEKLAKKNKAEIIYKMQSGSRSFLATDSAYFNQNTPVNVPMSGFSSQQNLMSKEQFQNDVNFKFDKIMHKIVRDILKARKIILDDEISIMRTNINKIYVFHIMKNTFDRIEKEILVKKFEKCIINIEQPILLCNLCMTSRSEYFCSNCEERLCYKCREVHVSNSLWTSHTIEKFFIPENKLEREDETHLNRIRELTQSNTVPKSSIMNSLQKSNNLKNVGIPKGLKISYGAGVDLSKDEKFTSINKTLKKSLQEKQRQLGSSMSDPNTATLKSPSNSYFKITGAEKGFMKIDNGIFMKMEGFCLPDKTQNVNYDNLKSLFDLLYMEYIDHNGITQDNLVDSKKLIEDKIDTFDKMVDNPLMVLSEDFCNKFHQLSYNMEEQFFINRIAFMLFKQYGASLTAHNIFEILKIIQVSFILMIYFLEWTI